MPPSIDDFILSDPAVQADPYAFYPLLREQKPVLKTDFRGQPCWVLSRRKDISAVLMDPRTYSSKTSPTKSLLFADPPEHSRLRGMVAERFTRTAVAPMSERVEPAAIRQFEPCLTAGRCDGIRDFASPLTITMMGQLLGIAVEKVQDIRGLTHLLAEHALAIRLGATPRPEAQGASDDIRNLFMGLVETGDYAPGGIFALLAERHGAGDLSADELVQFATLLFGAGHTTTTNLIGNCLYMLTQRPDDLARMREDEAFIEPFIEEVLRTRPSFHRILRITTREVELHGETIPAGSIVRLLLASANRDPEYFPDGEEFDPDRKARMHSSFGQGIHSCLGSWLARLEARTALRIISRRAARIELDPDTAPTPLTGGTFNEFGFEHLPILIAPLD
ncbi:cytochrome P450 [Sphingobium jiangsuense]|uniref:Cytochrome P450 n=1 Tax=Sphingobium jiangsuense TaxID=870476 RepID=A0A7W6BL23_9SPHN|nr:cytochrome P450 [Sphingobium jiangsuense]MBB3927047.1 cytochrome P450 [Sphingobium jiangsuense]GLT00286.1 cytochrome P450 [Sphingobium jiangsuense]